VERPTIMSAAVAGPTIRPTRTYTTLWDVTPRRHSAVVLAALAALPVEGAFATRASASWYRTQRQAEHDTVQVARNHYGLHIDRSDVECTPRIEDSGLRHYAPRHQWVCSWIYSDGSSCDGILLIRGSNHAAFRYLVWSGRSCEINEESD